MKRAIVGAFFILCACAIINAQTIVLSGNDTDRTIQMYINRIVNDNGLLDQTFGNLGTTYTTPTLAGGTLDQINAIGIQEDGKIVVAGRTNDQNGQTYFGVARYLSNGKLDITFGETTAYTTSLIPGTVYINIFAGHVATYTANALVIQPNGNIVVGGLVPNLNGTNSFGMVRLLSDGTLDPSFGVTQGGTTSAIPGTLYIAGNIGNANASSINALALQSDGKIVAGGTAANHYAIARFLPTGELDTSFGAAVEAPVASLIQGTVYINEYIAGGANDQMTDLFLQADGKIVGTGNSNDAHATSHVAAVRFMPDGSLDSSFGQTIDASTTAPFPGAVYITNLIIDGGVQDSGLASTLQTDGSFIIAGYSESHIGNNYFSLARFLPNGVLDSSFGQNSDSTTTVIPGTVYVSLAIGPRSEFYAVATQTDQTIVAGGFADIVTLGRSHFTVARFLQNGLLDPNFGGFGADTTIATPGIVYITNSISGLAANAIQDYMYAAAIQKNGNIVTAGLSSGNNNTRYFALARFFNPNNFNTYTTAYESVGAGVYC